MNTPDTEWEGIYKRVRSNSRAILYSDLIGLGIENERNQCGRDDMWAITTDELDAISAILTSRDTYWKERVRKEVEVLKSKAFSIYYENLPSPVVAEEDLDTLLDNLK